MSGERTVVCPSCNGRGIHGDLRTGCFCAECMGAGIVRSVESALPDDAAVRALTKGETDG